MSDQLFLGAIIGPLFLILGLSVLLYAGTWQKIANEWEKNHFLLIAVMLFNVVFGLAVINMYNTWDLSPYLIVTLTGWIALFKGVFYFLVPGSYFKAIVKALNCKCYYRTSGATMAALGVWLSYVVYIA